MQIPKKSGKRVWRIIMESWNEWVQQEYGWFSFKGLNAKLRMPNIYLVDSVKDLSENIQFLRPTGYKIMRGFSFNIHYYNNAVIFLPNVKYIKLQDYVPYWWDIVTLRATKGILERLEKDPSKLENSLKKAEDNFHFTHNGEVNDMTGVLPVRCRKQIPERIRLYYSMLNYDFKKKTMTLEKYISEESRQFLQEKDEELNLRRCLVPEYAF